LIVGQSVLASNHNPVARLDRDLQLLVSPFWHQITTDPA